MSDEPIIKYRVTVDTPKGAYDVDLISAQGPEAAARRAVWSLVTARYGDLGEVTATATVEICMWYAMCDNVATTKLAHPVLGMVPICETCRMLAQGQSIAPEIPSHTFDGEPACGKDVDGQGRLCNDTPGHEGECQV